MINFKSTYDTLHSQEIEDIIYIARKYHNALTDENKNTAEDLENKRVAFTNLLNTIYGKRFLSVTCSRNNNNKLVRKYFSTNTMRNWSEETRVRELGVSEENSVFVKMSSKSYDKMELNDKSIRYLPNSPSTILEQIAVQLGRADDSKLKFFMGPDVDELASIIGYTGTTFNFEDFKPIKGTAAPKARAIDLPLFSTKDGNKTYQELVDEGDYVLVISRGEVNVDRSFEATSFWSKADIGGRLKKMYTWTNDEHFNKKIAFIKSGDYRRIQKFVKNEVLTWDELLRKNVTEDTVTAMNAFGCRRTVKNSDRSAIFGVYVKDVYECAQRVAAKLGTLTEKQKAFLADIKTTVDINDCDYDSDAAEWAYVLNRRLSLGAQLDSNQNKIDLGIETKYPWDKMMNVYKMDDDENMKMLFHIVEVY